MKDIGHDNNFQNYSFTSLLCSSVAFASLSFSSFHLSQSLPWCRNIFRRRRVWKKKKTWWQGKVFSRMWESQHLNNCWIMWTLPIVLIWRMQPWLGGGVKPESTLEASSKCAEISKAGKQINWQLSPVRLEVQQNSPLCSVLEVKCHSHCMLIPTILHCCIWKNCPALIFYMREAEEVSHKFNCLQIGENDRRSSACSLREPVTHHCSWFGREIPQFWS